MIVPDAEQKAEAETFSLPNSIYNSNMSIMIYSVLSKLYRTI